MDYNNSDWLIDPAQFGASQNISYLFYVLGLAVLGGGLILVEALLTSWWNKRR